MQSCSFFSPLESSQHLLSSPQARSTQVTLPGKEGKNKKTGLHFRGTPNICQKAPGQERCSPNPGFIWKTFFPIPNQWCSKCGPWAVTLASRELLEMQILPPHPHSLNQKLEGRSSPSSTSTLREADTCSSLICFSLVPPPSKKSSSTPPKK